MPWWSWLLAAVAAALLALTLAALALLWSARRDPRRKALRRRIRALPLRAKLRLVWRLLRDSRAPWWAKALLPALLVYLALPLDLIPDFVPVVGYLDDLLVIMLVVAVLLRALPDEVVEEQVSGLEGKSPAGHR